MFTYKKFWRRTLALLLVLILVLPGIGLAKDENYGRAKNIILMIPDGMNIESASFARYFTDSGDLEMDSINTGTVRTSNSNTPIADSAPAGTAMATGYKSQAPYIGTYPSDSGMPGTKDFDKSKGGYPLASVLEAAKYQGKSTGLVVTSTINHATPASFSAHHTDRTAYEDIILQQVYQDMDIVLGGGSMYLDKDQRKDGRDLIKDIVDLGYDYVTSKDELFNSRSDKIWGAFAPGPMAYDLDRPIDQPSLSEMTAVTLNKLSKKKDGFFLMVEGSQIDWAHHGHDPVASVHEILAFDEAVGVAKDFADTNKDTVLIVAADHGTGGMSIGSVRSSGNYFDLSLDEFTRYIKAAKTTCAGAGKLLNKDRSNIEEVFENSFGITDLTDQEIIYVKESDNLQMAIGNIVSDRSYIGWSTGGHVGGDVALYCYSTDPRAKVLTGNVENKDIGLYIGDLLGVDLDELSSSFYVPVRPAVEARGGHVGFHRDQRGSYKLVLEKDGRIMEVPIYTNYAIYKEKMIELPGLSIFSNGTSFVHEDILDMID